MAAKPSKPAITALKGDLDIFSIQPQAAGLKQSMEGPGPCVLDLSGLGDVDLSGIQLLLSAAAGREKGAFRVQGLTPALAARMQDLGLQAFLDEVRS